MSNICICILYVYIIAYLCIGWSTRSATIGVNSLSKGIGRACRDHTGQCDPMGAIMYIHQYVYPNRKSVNSIVIIKNNIDIITKTLSLSS